MSANGQTPMPKCERPGVSSRKDLPGRALRQPSLQPGGGALGAAVILPIIQLRKRLVSGAVFYERPGSLLLSSQ